MAEGVIALGSAAVIQVATTTAPGGVYTPGTYSNLSFMTSYRRNNQRQTSETSVFMKTTKVTASSAATRSITLNGLIAIGDTGQGILRAATESNDVIAVKILPDGTNGQVIIGRVGTDTYEGTPDAPQQTSFEVLAVQAPTVVGTGL